MNAPGIRAARGRKVLSCAQIRKTLDLEWLAIDNPVLAKWTLLGVVFASGLFLGSVLAAPDLTVMVEPAPVASQPQTLSARMARVEHVVNANHEILTPDSEGQLPGVLPDASTMSSWPKDRF